MAGPESPQYRYDDLSALCLHCTLKRSPEVSNTDGLIERSRSVMEGQGVRADLMRRYMSWLGGHAGDWADDFVSTGVAFGHSVQRAREWTGFSAGPTRSPIDVGNRA